MRKGQPPSPAVSLAALSNAALHHGGGGLQVGLQACRNLVQHGEHSKMVSMAEGCSDEMGRAMAGIMGASMRGRRQMVTAFSIMQELAAAQRR